MASLITVAVAIPVAILVIEFCRPVSVSREEVIPEEAGKLNNRDRSMLGMAQNLTYLKRYGEAIDIFQKLYNKYPENRDILLDRAIAFGYDMKLAEAREMLNKAEALYPEDKEIKFAYANILEANQQLDEARLKYEKLLELFPEDDEIKLKLADVCVWTKDYVAAERYYTELIAKSPSDMSLKLRLADMFFWSGRYDEAIAIYDQAVIDPALEKKKFKNRCDCYAAAKKYDKALEGLLKLESLYPDDIDIRIDVAYGYYHLGRFEEAQQKMRSAAAAVPEDTKVAMKIAVLLSTFGYNDEAISLCKEAVSRSPHDPDAAICLARLYAWAKRLEEAETVFRQIIAEWPDNITARKELARLVGWQMRYAEALRIYGDAIKELGPDEKTALEMAAKKAYYDDFDIKGIKAYKKWLEAGPDTFEPLFDLGQIYCRQMQWKNAGKLYDGILNDLPLNEMARRIRDKIDLRSRHNQAFSGYHYFAATGASRDAGVRYQGIYGGMTFPLRDYLYATVLEDMSWFHFIDPSEVNRQRTSIYFDYTNRPWFWNSFGYTLDHYTDKVGTHHSFSEAAGFKPIDQVECVLSFQKSDIYNNGTVLTNDISRKDYRARGVYKPNKRLWFGGDFNYADYSDDNVMRDWGFDASYRLFFEPRSLTLLYRFEEYDYDKQRTYYYSPRSTHFNQFGFELKQYLNKEIHWGSNDTYCLLRYQVSYEMHDQHCHNIYAGFHRDWNNRFSADINWSKKIYEHQKTYSEDVFGVSANYYF
jgi:tetratricopeptide (TPR) repeat protein